MRPHVLSLLAACCLAAHGRPADPPKPDSPDLAKVVAGVIDGTNAFRKGEKRAAVAADEKLTATAKYFAEYMARTDEYGHEADGKTPADRAKAYEYDYCLVSENIAYVFDPAGYTAEKLAKQLVTGWKESPGHRKNMLDPDATDTGAAVARSEKSGRYYAVQMFGRPMSAAVKFSVANEAGQEVTYEVGGESFDLPPGVTRTHTLCRPQDVTPKWDGGEKQAVRPENGAKFAVVKDVGVLALKMKK